MMRTILWSLLIVTTSYTQSAAQAPSYFYSTPPAGSGNSAASGLIFREQCLYTRNNFPLMPAGRVKAIYVRAADNYSLTPRNSGGKCVMGGFTAKIGYTADTVFKNESDTFRTGLTTVYGPDTFSIPCTGAYKLWIKIPVTKGNFYYNPEGAKFAVEIIAGPPVDSGVLFPYIMNSNTTGNRLRLIYTVNTNTSKYGSIIYNGMDVGFDLGQPAGVPGVSNITSFGLFPNPSTDGRFNISFETTQPVRQVVVSAVNITGQQVFTQQFAGMGSSFFQEVDMSKAARGMYFLKLEADGEVMTRRVLIE